MAYDVSTTLIRETSRQLSGRNDLVWVVGGAGSGKTTICAELSARYEITVYDADAHIYGSYHARFTEERHPVNWAWSTSPNGLAWLLDKPWDEFNAFNRAAIPEYLELLAEDVSALAPDVGVVVDGGICNPGVLAQVVPSHRIVCLVAPGQTGAEIWSSSGERAGMKEAIFGLPEPEKAWRTFLDFDLRISATILSESRESGIEVCSRREAESVSDFATRVAAALGIA